MQPRLSRRQGLSAEPRNARNAVGLWESPAACESRPENPTRAQMHQQPYPGVISGESAISKAARRWPSARGGWGPRPLRPQPRRPLPLDAAWQMPRSAARVNLRPFQQHRPPQRCWLAHRPVGGLESVPVAQQSDGGSFAVQAWRAPAACLDAWEGLAHS